MREFQHTVTTPDGIKLAVREYLPDVGAAQRNLLMVHGACEHGGRYAEFASAATANGWRVLVPDHRGHGLSTGSRVYVKVFAAYLDDLRLICRHFSLDPQHTALVGHSLGGLIVARLLESSSNICAAACVLSPYFGLRVHVDRWTIFIGRILAKVWPWYRFRSRVRSTDLSHNKCYLEARRKDTLIQPFVTAGWFFVVQHEVQQVHTDAGRFQLPLLVMQGGQDHVVDPESTRQWFQIAGSADKTLDMLPDHLHELLQEPDRIQTTQRILNWLDERVR